MSSQRQPKSGTEDSPAISATGDLAWRLRHWPHRCVFLGEGIQAWLVGLTARSVPLALAFHAGLTLIVTYGEIEVVCGGYPSCLGQGQSLVVSGGEMTQIDTGTEADVLVVIATCDHQDEVVRRAALGI